MSAIISDCGRYRYRLSRLWADGQTLAIVMLNPSTADAEQDDPTIRRCVGFARREGFGGIVVVNLFAYRATKPSALWSAPDADRIGPENDEHISAACKSASRVLLAWGSHGERCPGRALEVHVRAAANCRDTVCLGRTKDRHPRHPLMVRADQPFEAY